jgi:hypothetical protein
MLTFIMLLAAIPACLTSALEETSDFQRSTPFRRSRSFRRSKRLLPSISELTNTDETEPDLSWLSDRIIMLQMSISNELWPEIEDPINFEGADSIVFWMGQKYIDHFNAASTKVLEAVTAMSRERVKQASWILRLVRSLGMAKEAYQLRNEDDFVSKRKVMSNRGSALSTLMMIR